jgi:hypothetical protein
MTNPAFIASDEEAERDVMSTIQELADLAVKAAEIQHNLDEAISFSTNAEIAAITAVIEKVRPALRSIAGRMKVSYHSWWVGNTHTDNEVEYYHTKGVRLVDGHTYQKDSTGNSGSVEGTNVYLLVDGSFAKFEYSGYWSSWQGSSDKWEAEVTEISIEEYVRNWGGKLEDVVRILEEKFKGVIEGKAPEKTKKNLEHAKKLNAITELL